MTTSLYLAATAATVADVVCWLLLIHTGRVAEGNHLVSGMVTQAAAGARLALVILLGTLTVVAERLDDRGLTLVVRVTLGIAVVIGIIGAASTVAAL